METIEVEIPVTAMNEVALRSALKSAGFEFIGENGGGPGVRLRTRLPYAGLLRTPEWN